MDHVCVVDAYHRSVVSLAEIIQVDEVVSIMFNSISNPVQKMKINVDVRNSE